MVCGTTSNAGKSTLVAGLCRHYARQGLRVAPFKAQNMANNSAVTPSGHEIGRAQAWQAAAAGVAPEVAMNPVLLKPTGPGRSQVVVMGRPAGVMSAVEYHRHKPALLATVLDALDDLRRRYDVVVLEGAGSPAEINLLDHDIVNLRVAHDAGIPAVVVGDIDLGGVFAALFGTVALLPDRYRPLVRGFVINKFRGDGSLLAGAAESLEARCGVPTLGVLPWLEGPGLDGEDAMILEREQGRAPAAAGAGVLDVAVVRFPHLANFTDLDPLAVEPGVSVRFVDDPRNVGRPDLLVLPGSKATVADLAWLRARGLDRAVAACATTVLGICAGYQMLGRRIEDPDGVESPLPVTAGLGHLDVTTRFGADKVTRLRRGRALGSAVHGYQIHHGRVSTTAAGWIELDGGGTDGCTGRTPGGARVWATTLHGLLEDDGFRAALLAEVGKTVGVAVAGGGSFEAARQQRIDAVADAVATNLDLAALDRLVAAGARR
ncbi:cobyric acid synthase [Acidiferrimicrobium sp. IK]|uniref:cobyric acid synthase n=1 Tax=Acidiferrimicrobium sp. IK TaxID=2871700 RepID=UPI00396737CD